MPHIALILINFNGTKYLQRCIDSLLTQSYENFHIYFLDNVSTDESLSLAHKLYGQNPKVTIIANKENSGYVGGANQGCDIASEKGSKYVMLLNPDIVFDPDYIEKAIIHLESHPQTAAFTGKIRRYDFDKDEKTNYIDTVGLYCFRNRRIVDYGQGQQDQGQFDKPKEVFGVSGACPIYRVSALQDIAIPVPNGAPTKWEAKRILWGNALTESDSVATREDGARSDRTHELFDENFFMYKEDVDVSWRLRLRGWSIDYDPSAIAYHGRGTGILEKFSHKDIYKNRRHASQLAKYHAYKNQRLTQIKNEIWGSLIRDIFPILWKEILITGYIIFREPKLLKSTAHLLRQIPSALRKRRHIQRNRKVDSQHMKKWLHSANIKPL